LKESLRGCVPEACEIIALASETVGQIKLILPPNETLNNRQVAGIISAAGPGASRWAEVGILTLSRTLAC
jgi:hypothetical protein